MNLVKRAILSSLQSLGYDLVKRTPPAAAAAEDGGYAWAHIQFNPTVVPDEVYARAYPQESLDKRHFYNIGAGSFRHRYWTNVDYHSDWYSSVQNETDMINYDLFALQPLPVEDGCAEAVYTSHTVEHVNDAACANMFREAHRILKKGGVFRITTPNIDLDMAAYRRGDRDYFYYLDLYSHPDVVKSTKLNPNLPFNRASLEQIVLFVFATSTTNLIGDKTTEKVSDEEFQRIFDSMSYEDALNYCTAKCTIETQRKYVGYHMNWWNEAKALRMLREAGFTTVYRSGYGQSASPAMRDVTLFDVQDPKLSLYVEAIKN